MNYTAVVTGHLAAITLMLLSSGFEARAQIHRIGVLVPEIGRAQSQAQKGLIEELAQLGYQRRKNITLDIRNAKGNRSALQPAAEELAASKVELIFTTGTRATLAASAATRTIPIVFVHPGDPITLGLLNASGDSKGNVTGVAAFAAQTTATRLALLKEILPTLQRIHVYFDSNNSFVRANLARVESAAKNLALRVSSHGVKSVDEFKASVAATPSERDAAIFHIPDDLVESEVDFIFETARQKKLPTMFNEEAWAIAGAMAAHGPNYFHMGRQAGRLVEGILKGRSPAALQVERAAKFDLTLNYRTANIIGLRLSPEILRKADKVIR
jgi:putative ABC transport system substrate-binding protein